jgi:HEAT repeat protein
MNRPGLWANIHKKRKEGRPMRKPGSKGAPTAADFRSAQESLSFKRLKNMLSEELTPAQKQEVSGWERDPGAVRQTNHFFGSKDEVNQQLQGGGDKSEPHRAVEAHLSAYLGHKHEIPHEHYKAGTTIDKYGRQVKIGSLLQKAKAPPELINSFANDSTRQLKKESKLTVNVTRSAAGVAGQTSGNQSWRDQSCKNFETGSNRKYLKPEVKHGTVVAYLKNHLGHELARATFHPHHDENGNVVYRQNSYYGPKVREFQDHIKGLETSLSQPNAPTDSVYKLHPEVYNDMGPGHEVTLHPHVKAEHLDKLLDHSDNAVRLAAVRHPNATSEHIRKALKDKNYDVRTSALTSNKISPQDLDGALSDASDQTRRTAILNKNASPENIHKALNDKDFEVKYHAAMHGNASAENIHKALDDSNPMIRSATLHRRSNASEEHIDRGLNDADHRVRAAAAAHLRASALQIHKALTDKNKMVRHAAAMNPNATVEHLHKALNDKDTYVRRAAAAHENATTEILDRAFNHSDHHVRQSAASNPNATDDHLKNALKDPHPDVRSAVKLTISDRKDPAAAAQRRRQEEKTMDESVNIDLPKNREEGTNSLTSIFRKATPGQTVKRVVKEQLDEAEYQGRNVPLGKPMKGDVKKSKVYVKNEKGNVVKVNFGDPEMSIKKHIPARRKSFRARHNCDNPGPRTKARFWACKSW